MSREEGSIYIKYDFGEDIPTVLRRIADNIANGRIACTGAERNTDEDRNYWVKDCGGYEILVTMPFGEHADMVYDTYGKKALCFDVRKKRG